jgi:hypothetical protein
MIRAVILSATIAALVTLWMDQPAPFKATKPADYCLIDYKAVAKHPLTGERVEFWTQGYGTCDLQDKFFEI